MEVAEPVVFEVGGTVVKVAKPVVFEVGGTVAIKTGGT